MKCPTCNSNLALLFTSFYCPTCENKETKKVTPVEKVALQYTFKQSPNTHSWKVLPPNPPTIANPHQPVQTFDFQDGKGPVPAHQHSDGGGWVANTAEVEDTVYVGPAATVFGSAKVRNNCYLEQKAKIFGFAVVSGSAFLRGGAEVSGFAKIANNASVRGDAKVHGNATIMDNAIIMGDAVIKGMACISGNALISTGTYN
jgi:carbonic anhydrase/acetyltransferase-like protein (isoleucine patch superfamily)/predicted RNA-binding Zn-ribbon protein involved in translation (DUF1610 family)